MYDRELPFEMDRYKGGIIRLKINAGETLVDSQLKYTEKRYICITHQSSILFCTAHHIVDLISVSQLTRVSSLFIYYWYYPLSIPVAVNGAYYYCYTENHRAKLHSSVAEDGIIEIRSEPSLLILCYPKRQRKQQTNPTTPTKKKQILFYYKNIHAPQGLKGYNKFTDNNWI